MTIQELYIEKKTLEEVKNYLTAFLTEEGVKRMFNNEADGCWEISAAKTLIDQAFQHLDDLFGSKTKKKKNIINEAR